MASNSGIFDRNYIKGMIKKMNKMIKFGLVSKILFETCFLANP